MHANPKISIHVLFAVAFIEGAAVMAIELSGVKIMAPFFGTTLFVWSAVLSVTLGGLALGYFVGGRLSQGTKLPFKTAIVLLAGAVFVALMPYSSRLSIYLTGFLDIRSQSLVTAICFLAPPLTAMGMISPLLIQIGSEFTPQKSGKTAGMVYAISTVGGILMTLIMGLYLLPSHGIRVSLLLVTILLGVTGAAFMVLQQNFRFATVGAMAVLFIPLSWNVGHHQETDQNSSEPLYRSEGILGQVAIHDFIDHRGKEMRSMLINGVPQSMAVKRFIPFSAWNYPHRIATIASTRPKGSNALLVGLAGGSLAMELKGLGFEVDAVEIDPRMPEIAQNYFGLDTAGINLFLDDGRNYIQRTEKKYDLIIVDILNGESQPQHLVTLEAFQSLNEVMSDSKALLIFNFQGYLNGPNGLAARSIYKTLQAAGFHVQHHRDTSNDEKDSDILFIASKEKHAIKEIDESRLNLCCQMMAFERSELLSTEEVDLSDALVLTDDRPALEKMNIHWLEQWRSRRIKDYAWEALWKDEELFK